MAENVITGKGHEDVIDEIRNAENHVYISSPWISKEYAQLIKEKNDEGVDVKVVTSADTRNQYHKESLQTLTEQEELDTEKKRKMQLAGAGTVLTGLIPGLLNNALFPGKITGYIISAILVMIGGGILFYTMNNSYRWVSAIEELEVIEHSPYEKLHSKIYIIDRTAYTGSLNLTQTAVNRNIETIVELKEERHVNDLEKQLNQIDMAQVPIPEIAQQARIKDKEDVKDSLSMRSLLGLK